jgi:hypothetical protein
MNILVEGHQYQLKDFEGDGHSQTLQFIHKEPGTFSGELVTVANGTTNEELLEVLINRMQYLQGKFPCKENACAITHLEEALMWLEKRTRDRVKRGVEGKQLK